MWHLINFIFIPFLYLALLSLLPLHIPAFLPRCLLVGAFSVFASSVLPGNQVHNLCWLAEADSPGSGSIAPPSSPPHIGPPYNLHRRGSVGVGAEGGIVKDTVTEHSARRYRSFSELMICSSKASPWKQSLALSGKLFRSPFVSLWLCNVSLSQSLSQPISHAG